MPRRSGEPIITLPRVLLVLLNAAVLVAAWATVRYIDQVLKDIPSNIQNEVSKQLPEAIKKEVPPVVKDQLTAQIFEQIKTDVASQTQQTRMELFQRQDEWQEEMKKRVREIRDLVSGNPKALGSTLKNSVSGNPIALKRTIPLGREFLEHAKEKALATRSKESAPTISQQDFNVLTKYLFREFRDPDLNTELGNMRVEVASFKTVVNGVNFGFPRPNQYSGRAVFIGDEEFKNTVFVDSHIILREGCPFSLQNVEFVNCTFEVSGPNGLKLLRTVLMSNKPIITLELKPTPGYVKGGCQK